MRTAWETAHRARLVLYWPRATRRFRGYQPRDADNALASFKAGIDGLVDARLLDDDDSRTLTEVLVKFVPDQGEGLAVLLTRLPKEE